MEKTSRREKARELRLKGHSLAEISRTVNAAKSTISIWVSDIELTKEQLEQVTTRIEAKRLLGRQKTSEKYREIRRQHQIEGKELAKKYKSNFLFVSGCMLYWGEGTKAQNCAAFTNSDIFMHKLYLKFFRTFFNKEIKAEIHCYTDLHSYEEILEYWSSNLQLPKSCFTQPQINNAPKSAKKDSNQKQKCPYGVLKLKAYSVEIIQKIYGAIQELGGFVEPKWLR